MVALEEIVIVLLPPPHFRIAPTHPIRYVVEMFTVMAAPEPPAPPAQCREPIGEMVIVVGGSVVTILASVSRALIRFLMPVSLVVSTTTVYRAPSRAASVTACLMFHARPNSMI